MDIMKNYTSNNSNRFLKKQKDKPFYSMSNLQKRNEQKMMELELWKYCRSLKDLIKIQNAKIRESERKYHTLFNSLNDNILVVGWDFRICEANDTFLSKYNFKREDILGHRCHEVLNRFIKPCDKHWEDSILSRVFETGESSIIKDIKGRADSSNSYFDVIFSPLKDGKGIVNQVIVSLRNKPESVEVKQILTKVSKSLVKRTKEVEYFYKLFGSELSHDLSLDKLLQISVDLIPGAWQYPEITCGRIIFKDKEFKTKNFEMTKWKQTAEIKINGETIGRVEVCYLEEKPDEYEGPFLIEERALVEGIASLLRQIINYREADEKTIEKYKSFFENAVEGLFQTSPAGHFICANPAIVHMLGFQSQEELFNNRVDIRNQGYVHPEKRDEFMSMIEKSGFVKQFEYQVYRKDGNKIWLSENARAIRDLHGKISLYEGTVEDISERKHLEEELKQANERLKMIFEFAPDPYFLIDTKGKLLDGNRMTEFLTQYKRDELIGKNFLKDTFLPKNQIAKAASSFAKNISGNATGPEEYTLIRKDKTQIDVEMTTYQIKIKNQEIVLSIARDISMDKQTQKSLLEYASRLEKSIQDRINVLSLTIEKRDPYTAGHQHKATQLAVAIAKEMMLPEEKIKAIQLSGIVHDIGKIEVPSEILNKPSKLNNVELLLLKRHPRVGYDILSNIELPWQIAKIVLQHHERMDGSGYPDGLSGDEILIEARILAVADVVEAMSSHRPYRKAFSINKTLMEIEKNTGILYDPEVAIVCLKLFSEKKFKFKQNCI